MSDHLRKSIDDLMHKLKEQEAAVLETKKAINILHGVAGLATPFKLDDEQSGDRWSIRPDSFFGKGLATAVGEFLEMQGHAVSVDEIMKGLRVGGYDFGKAKYPERVLRINLGKNTAKFVQIKNSDSFGLRKWYPNLSTDRKDESNSRGSSESDSASELDADSKDANDGAESEQ